MRRALSAKDTMLWRLALCRIFVHSRNSDLAVPHFDRVLEDIQTHRLEEWDPMLALQGLKAVWAGFQKVSDKAVRERAALVLHRIARIDPVEAVRIGK
jgi:type VI secretion system protein VasJ